MRRSWQAGTLVDSTTLDDGADERSSLSACDGFHNKPQGIWKGETCNGHGVDIRYLIMINLFTDGDHYRVTWAVVFCRSH